MGAAPTGSVPNSDTAVDARRMVRWVITRHEERAGRRFVAMIATPRGKMASLDDPRTWSDYAAMRRGLSRFAGYEPGFVILAEDRAEDLVSQLVGVEPEVGRITLFRGTPLAPEGLMARDERREAARGYAAEAARVRRALHQAVW